MKLRVRALPNGQPHPFFRRAGLTFPVGHDVVVEVDEATASRLSAEVDRLKVELVDEATPATSPAEPSAPPLGEDDAPARPPRATETTADGAVVPMVGGASTARGGRRS